MPSPRKRLIASLGLVLLAAAVLLNACNMPRPGAPANNGAGGIYTAAAQTVAVQMTTVSQSPPTVAPATQAANTPIPQGNTPAPAATAAAASTTASAPCDLVKFVDDVTVPDNTEVAPGATFVKTWRLQNAGTCTWTTAYSLVPDGPNLMSAPPALPITTGQVAPGERVDISVTLRAPNEGGAQRANFKLRNGNGQVFGTEDGSKPFWVLVKVTAPVAAGAFDFISQASSAEWRSVVGPTLIGKVNFGGADDDPNGSAKIKDNITLENGAASGKVLLTVPRWEKDGAMVGVYPPYTVQNGDHFRARIGFWIPGGGCDQGSVRFQLYYQEGETIKLLGEWDKECDGRLAQVDVDLSSLQGRTVQPILCVRAGNSSADDWAIWSSPVITR